MKLQSLLLDLTRNLRQQQLNQALGLRQQRLLSRLALGALLAALLSALGTALLLGRALPPLAIAPMVSHDVATACVQHVNAHVSRQSSDVAFTASHVDAEHFDRASHVPSVRDEYHAHPVIHVVTGVAV